MVLTVSTGKGSLVATRGLFLLDASSSMAPGTDLKGTGGNEEMTWTQGHRQKSWDQVG